MIANSSGLDTSGAIAVIGLGYVGLPLATAFGRCREVIGFDVSRQRIDELKNYKDRTMEVSSVDLLGAKGLRFTSDVEDLREACIYIITVPTPIDAQNRPDLSYLTSASETVGRVIKPGNVVIYESTVYPGCTEEECIPVIEKASGLRLNMDFFAGYSPERINPGDETRRIADIVKVTSGSTPAAADAIDALYRSIIVAGTYKAESIRVAEAAKVIENTQRDVNIALVNELAIIFNKLNIDTNAVLDAAATKWNFIRFSPGLVGGHCIGVDPYYLTHKAESIGYHPQLILSGRQLNDAMPSYVVSQLAKKMEERKIQIDGSRILVMGATFKENCPDVRNSKVMNIISELKIHNCNVEVYDPWISDPEILSLNFFNLIDSPCSGTYDAIIVTVAHKHFQEMGVKEIRRLGKSPHVLYDIKNTFPAAETDVRL
jgi:UDP-N-acetyl-D-galactosamine dehydrogenase